MKPLLTPSRGDVCGDVYDEVLMMKKWGAMEIHRMNHKIVSFNICILQ